MGSTTVGINVIYVCCNVDVNKDCMFGKTLPQIPVLLARGHLQCRDTCLDRQVSLQDRFYCILLLTIIPQCGTSIWFQDDRSNHKNSEIL